MIFAREKKKENIAEYILYMWQVEDIIRACNFDLQTIEKKVMTNMGLEKSDYDDCLIWYEDLIGKMKDEGIEKKGHLAFVKDHIIELEKLSETLLKDKNEEKYHGLYSWAKSNIEALKQKSTMEQPGDIEICLTGLYGILMLKLRKKSISAETAQAMQTISNLMAYLAAKYHKNTNGS